MYILIQHEGTKNSLEAANKIQFIAEDEYGATCEQVIGVSDDIVLSDDSGRELIKLSTTVTDNDIRYILNLIIEEDK